MGIGVDLARDLAEKQSFFQNASTKGALPKLNCSTACNTQLTRELVVRFYDFIQNIIFHNVCTLSPDFYQMSRTITNSSFYSHCMGIKALCMCQK